MLKNFSPQSLGINGRQSELIELALTYAFKGLDIDMYDMHRRSQRTDLNQAAKYLRATKLEVGVFNLDVDLDSDDDAFTNQVAALNPLADMAKELGAKRASLFLPACSAKLSYREFFDQTTGRIAKIVEVLKGRDIQLAVGMKAGKELDESAEFPFIRNAEGLIALVRSIDGAGLYLDTWDWVVGDGAMDQISELTKDDVAIVRLGSLSATADSTKATSSDRVLPEAEGALNHVSLIKHLASIGFDGPVSPSASPTQYKGQTRELTVKKAQEAVDGIFKEAGLEVDPLPMDLIEDIPYEPTPSI